MQKKSEVVEDALIQIKNLEEALQENAKGILASTMKEEIKQLVKESLNEQDEDDDEEVANLSVSNTEINPDEDVVDDTDSDIEMKLDSDDEDDEDEDFMDDETIDMTAAPDSEVLRVFTAMGPEDGIIVTKNDDMINLKDGEKEYMIRLGESELDDMFKDEENESWSTEEDYDFGGEEKDEYVFEITLDEDEDELEIDTDWMSLDEDDDFQLSADEEPSFPKFPEDEDDLDIFLSTGDEDSYGDLEEEDGEDSVEDKIMEAIKKSMKPKGVGVGRGPKFNYDKKPNMSGGFNTKRKEAFGKGTKAVGTGKAKFEYKEGESKEGWDKVTMGGNKGDKSKTHMGKKDYTKKEETKEASRTLGAGKYWGKPGLPKPKAAPSHLRIESVNGEVNLLREKNEEYKKALDVFRTKLNEVAVFNSNLAYATRLFTEHSTTKQEKINILRRFDNVESLKESKNLYRVIKDELGSVSKGSETTIKESFERNVVKTPTTGSATNLIESKTYENPQFLRMKDLMGKLK